MNEILHQILELDKRAVRIKESVEQHIEKIELDTNEKIKENEKIRINALKAQNKIKYCEEMEVAEKEREKISRELKEKRDTQRIFYEQVKDKYVDKVLVELFTSN